MRPGECDPVGLDARRSLLGEDRRRFVADPAQHAQRNRARRHLYLQGWAAAEDYLGAADLTNADKFLSAGAAGAAGTYYYAVWEKSGVEFPNFPILPELPTEDVPALLNAADHDAYLQGYPDGTVRPENSITRAEVAAIVNRMLEREADAAYLAAHQSELLEFRDLLTTHWAYDHIMEAANGHTYVAGASGETWTGLK